MNTTPGLPSVGRRVGTASTFSAAMRAGLTRSRHPLTTRSADDPTIALVDAWAEVLDVLAFYSGRIADEGYLRTATEALSVAELADTVSYAPGRGRAATTLLAFTLEGSPGSPPLVPVPRGTRVASVPGPGQVPQTYETTEDLEARPEWNAVPVRSRRPRAPSAGDTWTHVQGLRTDLRPGDAVLLVGAERAADPTSQTWALRLLSAVEQDAGNALTVARWADPLGDPPEHSGRAAEAVPGPTGLRLHALRLRAGIFGASAPDPRLISRPEGTTTGVSATVLTTAVESVTVAGRRAEPAGSERAAIRSTVHDGSMPGPDWPEWSVQAPGQPDGTVDLDAVYAGIVPGSWVVLSRPGATVAYLVDSVQEVARTDYTLNAKVTRVRLAGPSVATHFGSQVRETVAHVVSEPLPLAAAPEPMPVDGELLALAHPVPALPGGRTVVVRGPRPVVRVAEGVHDLALAVPGSADVPLHPGQELEVVGAQAGPDGPVTWQTTVGTVTAPLAQLQLVPPAADATPHSEVTSTLAPVPGAGAVDELLLTGPLTGCYDPATVRVLANVASASHGETQRQVLGSGDATRAYQRFTLSKAPLTYLPGPHGDVRSTLEVRVDGRAWAEVPRLFGAGPHDEVFTTEVDATGSVTVCFGDGRTGARLPTGAHNVTATYRFGTGLEGRVAAGQLSLLMTRPLGVRSVTNPQAAGLAADPEPTEDVRAGAARTALTLDRVVSLRDVEDYARAVPGVGKALAARVWDGRTAVVLLTVASSQGEGIDDQALADLEAAVRAAGAPRLPLTVRSAEVVPVRVAATLVVDPAHDPVQVLAEASAALTAVSSAPAREIGEPFRLGDLVLAAHGVPGVLALRVRTPEHDVPALSARREDDRLAPAQLVCLEPGGLDVQEAGP